MLFSILAFVVLPNVTAKSAIGSLNLTEAIEQQLSPSSTNTSLVTKIIEYKLTQTDSPTITEQAPTLSTPTPTKVTPTSTSITSTLTHNPTITPTVISNGTTTSTPEPSLTPSQTPARTPEPTFTITPTITLVHEEPFQESDLSFSHIYLPFLQYQEPLPYITPELELFCSSPNQSIPDNDSAGLTSTIHVTDPRILADLNVYLKVDHSYVGDLRVTLTHENSARSITIFDRPGIPGSGCEENDIRAIFDDEMTWHVETKCASYPAAISGSYESDGLMSTFDGLSINGDWILNISDNALNDKGVLKEWCLAAQISENPPPLTPPPPTPELPLQKIINGVTGKPQSLPLDCESRSAVDWAKYFGKSINELTFFNQLPHSDNPDKGFVGSVYGTWGQIPPNPYGVHAEPVAEVLRDYGLPAKAHRPLSWHELRAEIAAGRPVIVWIIGSISLSGSLMNGAPEYYTPTDGLHTVVARYEHTVVVTGYTSSFVYYLNGDKIYQINSDKFLDSWSALGNMAITWTP